jgi:hypothetical protein
MLKLLLIILFIVSFTSGIYSQYNPGAKQIALANSDVGQANDVFSVFTNPAGLAQMNWREIGVYYSPAPFGFSELANGFIGYHEPFSFGSFGVGAMTYGFDLYRESRATVAFSYNYNNNFFAGIGVNYHTVSIKNYGSTGAFYADLGGLIYFTDYLRWGFCIHNINHASIGAFEDQIPVILNAGVSIDILYNFTLNTAIEKDIRYNASIMFGFDYQLIEYLSLMSGFSNEPSRFTAGIGIHYSFLNLDYAVFTHTDLGLTHQAGVIINFGSDEPGKDKIRKNLGIK